ncbi:MAG: hypothetical protein CFE24_13540 [Flavobacterium sp. BFFFF2]|nr:MAG: hypothetical protein CFE24_13540 [Flavobacterium sp. BFFFF2]
MKKIIQFYRTLFTISVLITGCYSNAQEVVGLKQLLDSNGFDASKSNFVAKDNNNNIFATGHFKSNVTIEGTQLSCAGGSDIYLMKYDVGGTVVWSKRFGGNANDVVNAITTDSAGNIYLAGSFTSTSLVFSDTQTLSGTNSSMFVVKLDTSGSVVWAKGSSTKTAFDEVTALNVDSSGNVFMGGSYTSSSLKFGDITLTNENANSNLFIAKLDSQGAVQWANGYGGTSDDKLNGLTVDAAGNVIAVGSFDSTTLSFDSSNSLTNSSTFSDLFIAKWNTNGAIQWVKSASGALLDQANAVTTDVAKNIYVVGAFKSTSLSIGGLTISNGNTDNYITSFVLSLNETGTAANWFKQVNANYLYALDINENSKSIYTSGTVKKTPSGSIGFYCNIVFKVNYTSNAADVKEISSTLDHGDQSRSIIVDNQDNFVFSATKQTQQTFTKIMNTKSFCFAYAAPTVGALSTDYNWYLTADSTGILTAGTALTSGQIIYGQLIGGSGNKRNQLKLTNSCSNYAFRDQDGDGYISNQTNDQQPGSVLSLPENGETPSGYLTYGPVDCDDTNASKFITYSFGLDADADGFPSNTNSQTACAGSTFDPPAGYAVFGALDCDDTKASIYPGATEVFFNNIDDDCNGLVDDAKILTSNILALSNFINCTSAFGYTEGYRFEVNDQFNGRWVIDTALPMFKLSDLNATNFIGTSAETSPYYLYNKAANSYFDISDFSIKVALKKNGQWQPYGPTKRVTTQDAPTAKITTNQCGKIFATTDKITIDPVTRVESYQLHLDTESQILSFNVSNIATLTNPNPSFKLSDLPALKTRNYLIGVSFVQKGIVFGPYSVCNIKRQPDPVIATPTPPATTIPEPVKITKILSTQCGTTLASTATTLYCGIVSGAQAYRFEVSNGGTEQTLDRSSNNIQLTSLQGGAAFATTYSVRVAVQIAGSWQAYGDPCSVTTPSMSLSTKTTSTQCNSTLANKWTPLYCNAVTGATAYRFEWTNGGTALTFTSSRANMQLGNYTGWAVNTTYSVRVAAQIGTVWQDYGSPCNVTTPASMARGVSENETALTVKAVPNPFETEYVLIAQGGNQTPVLVTVYDMLGKQVEQFSVETNELENRSLGTNYTSGIYNVMISQGDDQQVVRIIKK